VKHCGVAQSVPLCINHGVQEEIAASAPTTAFTPGRFLEIFIGSGSLSRAVLQEASDYVEVLSKPGSVFNDVDVSSDCDFEMLLDTSALWKHMAPPCKSFSRARRADHIAVAKTLRSDSRPEGFGCSMTKDANKLVERCIEICRKQIDEDVFFSVENPWNSYVWDLRCVKALLKINEVQLKRVDQCTAGSPHFKPTGILTNAPWIKERLCNMKEVPHHHVPLVGLVQDYRTHEAELAGEKCFYTALAAEYPEGLCKAWAQDFRSWIQWFIADATDPSNGYAQMHLSPMKGNLQNGLGGLGLRPCSGTGIVGEYVRQGEFGNRLVAASLLKRKLEPNAEPSVAKVDSSLGSIRRGVRLTPAKAIREAQNTDCIGGLRNPNMAVARSKSLQSTGRRIRGILDKLLQDELWLFEETTSVVDSIGKPGCQGFSTEAVLAARTALTAEFGSTFPEVEVGNNRSLFQSNLWEAMLADAGDPETEIVGWMRHGCPTGGVDSRIHSCGIFPLASGATSAVESSKVFSKIMASTEWDPTLHTNYKSFDVEGGVHSNTEVARIKQRNFIEVFRDWATVKMQWPLARASKVALIIKERVDKSLKLRFVVDLRRSGVNGEAEVPERVVLPRVIDFANSIVNLQEVQVRATAAHHHSAKEVELLTLDFADAFYTLWLRPSDRGSLVFKVADGWAVFNRLCFGMAGAPLIWGRLAAAACRLGQSCFQPEELRLQCYVDDPAIAVLGSQQERNRLIIILLLLWSALGLALSWEKGSRGTSVPWIGVNFKLDKRPHQGAGRALFPGVEITVQQAKFNDLRNNVEAIFHAKGLIPMKDVLKVAGQLAWIGGIFPWVRGFNACLWSAITDHVASTSATSAAKKPKVSMKKRPTHLMFVRRISQAVAWTRLLLSGLIRDQNGTPMVVARWISVAHRVEALQVCIRTDASPYGMGAILFRKGSPILWMALDWSPDDLAFLKAQIGDPAWQAEWELFAILIAIDAWLPHLRGQAAFLLQADATAALFTATRLAGRTPAMNAIAVEIAIRMESADVTLSPEHLRGTLNFECDALSRLAQGAAVPEILQNVPRTLPKSRRQQFFWAACHQTTQG